MGIEQSAVNRVNEKVSSVACGDTQRERQRSGAGWLRDREAVLGGCDVHQDSPVEVVVRPSGVSGLVTPLHVIAVQAEPLSDRTRGQCSVCTTRRGHTTRTAANSERRGEARRTPLLRRVMS